MKISSGLLYKKTEWRKNKIRLHLMKKIFKKACVSQTWLFALTPFILGLFVFGTGYSLRPTDYSLIKKDKSVQVVEKEDKSVKNDIQLATK